MAAIRQATAIWQGDLKSGTGMVLGESSRAFQNLGISWKARAEKPDGQTSPEELLAAAHAGCFSMALAAGLAQGGHRPTALNVRCTVTFDPVALKVTSSLLEVRGQVPGIDPQGFERAAGAAKDGCPISRALAGNVSLDVKATLESGAEQPSPAGP